MTEMPWNHIEGRSIEIGVMDEDPKILELDSDYSKCSRYAGVVLAGDEYAQCRIANIGAGTNRGLFMAPREGDQVLVVFPGGRENSGIILGALNSNATPAPGEVESIAATLMNPDGILLTTEPEQPAVGAGNIKIAAPSGNVTIQADVASDISLVKTTGSSPSRLVKEGSLPDIEAVFDSINTLLLGLGLSIGPSLVTFKAAVAAGTYKTDTVEAD